MAREIITLSKQWTRAKLPAGSRNLFRARVISLTCPPRLPCSTPHLSAGHLSIALVYCGRLSTLFRGTLQQACLFQGTVVHCADDVRGFSSPGIVSNRSMFRFYCDRAMNTLNRLTGSQCIARVGEYRGNRVLRRPLRGIVNQSVE